MPNIPESDWKYLRKIKDDLLNNVCNKAFLDIELLLKESKGQEHSVYLKLWKLLRKRDREIADMFDDLKRSNAILKIANMVDYGALTEKDFMNLTDSTKERVNGIIGLRKEL